MLKKSGKMNYQSHAPIPQPVNLWTLTSKPGRCETAGRGVAGGIGKEVLCFLHDGALTEVDRRMRADAETDRAEDCSFLSTRVKSMKPSHDVDFCFGF